MKEMILLNLSGYSSYTVSAGALSGSANPYTLFMPDQDVIISSAVGESSAIDQLPLQGGDRGRLILRNGILFIERNGMWFTPLGGRVK